jgi:hypothetical protein
VALGGSPLSKRFDSGKKNQTNAKFRNASEAEK